MRKKKLKELTKSCINEQRQMNDFLNQNASAIKASFRASQIIAEEGRPFTDGEFVKRVCLAIVEEICPSKIQDCINVSLSASTVTRRIEDIGSDIKKQLEESVSKFKHFSIAIDDSEDICHTAQLLIYIRGVNITFDVTEELIALKSLKDRATGENIFLSVSDVINDFGLNWNLLSAVTTDGAKNMTGSEIGFMGKLCHYLRQKNIEKPMQFHCIIHQQSLCGKFLNANLVMDVVISTINFIRKNGLNHRQFQTFLQTIEAEYGDVLYHTEVRWMSRGNVLNRFFDLRYEIAIFMNDKLKPVFELSDPGWLWSLAFLTDICVHLNTLNKKLQGRDLLINDLLYNVKSFETKLELFKNQFIQKNFSHFPCCHNLSKSMSGYNFPTDTHVKNIVILQKAFVARFIDFKSYSKIIHLFQNPFEIGINNVDDDLQLEVLDLQANDIMKSLFKTENLIQFYAKLSEFNYSKLKDFARKIISIFGSTYICEQTFSKMKYIKSKYRTRLTDLHLENFLQIGSSHFTPNITNLSSSKQSQSSH